MFNIDSVITLHKDGWPPAMMISYFGKHRAVDCEPLRTGPGLKADVLGLGEAVAHPDFTRSKRLLCKWFFEFDY
jgi:hypothetical protein